MKFFVHLIFEYHYEMGKEDCIYFNLCVTDRDPGYDEVTLYTVKNMKLNI